MKLRTWLWWPASSTYAVAGGIGILAVAFLGMSGLPRFPAFVEFEKIQGTSTSFAAWGLVLFGLNACVFFLIARGDYLKLRSAVRPIAISFFILAFGFAFAWNLFLGLTNGWMWPPTNELLWYYTTKCFFVGEGGLTMVLLFTGIWKPSSHDAFDILGALDRVQPLLRKLFRESPPAELSDGERRRLQGLLLVLTDSSEKLVTRPLLLADEEFAVDLAKHAQLLSHRLTIPGAAFSSLRNSHDAEMHEAVDFLLEELEHAS